MQSLDKEKFIDYIVATYREGGLDARDDNVEKFNPRKYRKLLYEWADEEHIYE